MDNAREEGREEGKEEEKIELILRSHKLGFDIETISKISEKKPEEVRQIIEKNAK